MRTALDASALDDLAAAIAAGTEAHERAFPGERPGRQPVHTVYVPADRVHAGTVAGISDAARRLLERHAADPATLAQATGIAADLAGAVHERLRSKLAGEPVEDLRVDFEDGYGRRGDEAEDADAERAARALVRMLDGGGAPPFTGLRIKSFADGDHRRALRTLDAFLSTLLDATGRLPAGFVVTFPKVVAAEHVAQFVEVLARLETALGLPEATLSFEVQIETTQAIVAPDGRFALPAIAAAGGGRLTGAHFGVFDYTAACGLPSDQQRLDHPACDFARHVMQVCLAGTGVRLSDGSTNRVPGDDSSAAVHAVWRHHAALVRRSIAHGFHQGWDLHPAHVVSRFAAVYAFHLGHIDDTRRRLAAWSSAAGRDAQAPEPAAADRGAAAAPSGGGQVLDEPATVRALVASLRRAVDCGAVDDDVSALPTSDLTRPDLP